MCRTSFLLVFVSSYCVAVLSLSTLNTPPHLYLWSAALQTDFYSLISGASLFGASVWTGKMCKCIENAGCYCMSPLAPISLQSWAERPCWGTRGWVVSNVYRNKWEQSKKHQWTSLLVILFIFSCFFSSGWDLHASFPILMNMFSIQVQQNGKNVHVLMGAFSLSLLSSLITSRRQIWADLMSSGNL